MKFTSAWTTSSGSRLWSMLSHLGTLVSILTPIVTIGAIILTGNADIPATILAVYVCLLVTVLLLLLLRVEGRYRREARYAPAMIPARKAFASLAGASWIMIEGDGSEGSFLLHLRESLRLIAETFSLITDAPCRASVKIITAGSTDIASHDIQVVTVGRSVDLEDAKPADRDRIGNNTDFRQIFTGNAPYFFSNDLVAQLAKGYQNSHWDERTIEERKFDYVATIVWPIGRSKSANSHGNAHREIVGFLCVDTLAVGVFNETYDVPLGAAFAQALDLAIQRFRVRQAADGSVPLQRKGLEDVRG